MSATPGLNLADAALLAALPGLAFQAVLILCRLGAAVMLLPGIGEAEVPANLRVALALGLVLALLPILAPTLPAMPEDVASLGLMLMAEIFTGIWIGLLARFLALALSQAGQVVALLIGLASPLQGDMVLGVTATALARMFSLATAALMLATGLYELPLRALVESYAVLPAGAGLPLGAAAETIARMAADSLALAMQLAAPFVLAAIFLNAALGLVARLAPQAQVFVVAAPVQILGGFLLLMLLLPGMLSLWWGGMTQGFLRLPGS
ncbi:flagellar biosynthetic protein FliR [Sediminicoccus sp. KRV36]|uniref:flagellar biosynthetic protein FliR n=1 Tax=Sediminicoccus sp. KRV36 TaxID=3133721 RepID=UPI00200F306E|nr:flagellar biosynthetic protein FliR [Sediminicoccus rosea]UPY38723.1 flagellar biosynthetic protein FliR [Sediminicoccus rosea]